MASRKRGEETSDPKRKPRKGGAPTSKVGRRAGQKKGTAKPPAGKRSGGVRAGHGGSRRSVGKVGAGRDKKATARRGGRLAVVARSPKRKVEKAKSKPGIKVKAKTKIKVKIKVKTKVKTKKRNIKVAKPATKKKVRRPVKPVSRKPKPKTRPKVNKPKAAKPLPPKRKRRAPKSKVPAGKPKKRPGKKGTGGGGTGGGGGPPAGSVSKLPIDSLAAEEIAQGYLADVQLLMQSMDPSLDLGIKSFVNRDRTVDAELRILNLPDYWRQLEGIPTMAEFLSEVFQKTGVLEATEDGRFWVSIGIRFGPSSEKDIGDLADLYKRHRGLLQVASYPVSTSLRGGFQNAVVAAESITKSLMEKRGIPASSLFVRLTWMPTGMNPSRFKGEKGGGD